MRIARFTNLFTPDGEWRLPLDKEGASVRSATLKTVLEKTPIEVGGVLTTIPAQLGRIVGSTTPQNAPPRTYSFVLAANQRTLSGADRNGRALDVGTGLTLVTVNGSTLLPQDHAANPSSDQVVLIDDYQAGSSVEITTWDLPTNPSLAVRRFVFVTSTSTQTQFSGADSTGAGLTVGAALTLLFVNGAQMPPAEFVASPTANRVTLSAPFAIGASVMIVTW